MLSISSASGITYRTKCLPRDRAARFAACVAANPRFCEVNIASSNRAKAPNCWFVEFKPVSEERQAAMFARQQTSREERALSEGAAYVWALDKDAGRPFFWLMSASGEVYEVDPRGHCSCPDFTYRCQGAGLKCKHLLALESGLGTVADTTPIPTAPEPVATEQEARRAQVRRELADLRSFYGG